MRKKLKRLNGQRKNFVGTFERYGLKNGYKGPLKTVLLKDIKDKLTGEIITDHLWFNFTKGFERLGDLETGQQVEFSARVDSYERGYKGYREDVYKPIEIDYRLSYPTKLAIVNQNGR